ETLAPTLGLGEPARPLRHEAAAPMAEIGEGRAGRRRRTREGRRDLRMRGIAHIDRINVLERLVAILVHRIAVREDAAGAVVLATVEVVDLGPGIARRDGVMAVRLRLRRGAELEGREAEPAHAAEAGLAAVLDRAVGHDRISRPHPARP